MPGDVLSGEDTIGVCLGLPVFQLERFAERLRAIDPRIELLGLPVDPEADWAGVDQGAPHPEPPPWAEAFAEERRAALARAEVFVALHAPDRLMELAPGLRWVQGIGAGVEQFAKAGVSRDRVIVTNASGVSSGSMAEWVIGRLLQVWKRFPESDSNQARHAFVRTYGRTFKGSTLGVVGLGHIGCAVADLARAFGVRVLGLRRSHRPGMTSDHADALYGPDQLHEMLALCDAAVVAAPATPETERLIDAAALAALPRGATLVNVARGSLVDEAAVVAALESGQLGAAALDVFDQEPLPPDSPLWEAPNLLISGHSSVSVDRYMDDVFDLLEDNLRRYVAGEPLRNPVDMALLGFQRGRS